MLKDEHSARLGVYVQLARLVRRQERRGAALELGLATGLGLGVVEVQVQREERLAVFAVRRVGEGAVTVG